MDAKKEILDSIEILIERAISQTTQAYSGSVSKVNADGTCEVVWNGKAYTMKSFGGTPSANKDCKIIVPQGNQNQAFIIC